MSTGTKRVPMSAVRGRSQFPAGTYRGTMAEIEDGQKDDGSAGSVNFQLQNNQVIDGEGNPGARPHFVRITTWMIVKDARGKETTLQTADIDPTDEEIPYNLRSAVAQLTSLAIQLGKATIDEGHAEFEDDLEAFIEQLRAGDYDGQDVDYVVTHSVSKKEREAAKQEGRQPKPFVNTEFLIPVEGAAQAEAASDDTETVEDETVEEVVEEVEEETPAPAKRPSLIKGAQTRQLTTKPSGAPKAAAGKVAVGSGKPKFVRKGGKR